jgi:hypothetical protein
MPAVIAATMNLTAIARELERAWLEVLLRARPNPGWQAAPGA